MGDTFDLMSGAIAIGDPTIELTILPLKLAPGRYRLVRGALERPSRLVRGTVVDTESMVVYAMDATVRTRFEAAFHEFGNRVSYDMAKMQELHSELEAIIGTSVGFYWVGDLSGSWSESSFVFNPAKVVPNRV